MFLHKHPYSPFIPEGAFKLIVGTLPPPRFSTGIFKKGDVDFCYGSSDGQLWNILDKMFNLNLKFETTGEAIRQRKDFLTAHRIGICDMVDSAQRRKIDATDLGMENVVLRDVIKYLKMYPTIHTLLFTGGNSKNGPEYFFRRLLKKYNLHLELINNQVPRIHQLKLDNRIIKTVSLTAPSGSANRAVGAIPLYKELKSKNPEFNTIDFRIMQYSKYFID